jgi:hypothetical protein
MNVCPYPNHRSSDWQLAPGAPVVCGRCHPPADSRLAQPAARGALAECETVIAQGLATFTEVGQALLRIRDERLYRETHDTFAAYFKERWGFSRQTGYDLMRTAQVVELVQEVGQPTREAARELASLEPDAMREAWAETIERVGEKPTAAEVRATVNGHKSKAAPPSADAEIRSAIDAAGRALRRAVKLIEKEMPSDGEPEWLERASTVADTARRYVGLVSREGDAPSDLDDLDFDHARRHLAEREAELREEAGSPARCVCARPLVGPEGTAWAAVGRGGHERENARGRP